MTTRTPYHHGDLPSALLRATVDLVTRNGAAGFSLRAAADEAGVSASAVYRHFRDRDALLRGAAAVVLDEVGARMDLALEGLAPNALGPRLHAVTATYLGFAVAYPERYRLVFGPHGLGHPGSVPDDEASHRPQQHFLRLACLAAAADGPLAGRDLADVSRSLWLIVHGAVALTVDGPFDPARALATATWTLAAMTGQPVPSDDPPPEGRRS